MSWRFVCTAKDKSKIKTYEQKAIKHKFVWGKTFNYTPLVWSVHIHCESKMNKQDLQTGER